MMTKINLIILSLILTSTNIFSQVSHDIKGYIIDSKSGETLVWANIIIENSKFGTTTNNRGYFIIVDAPKDTVTLIVSYIGYVTEKLKFDNSKGNTGLLQIELTPSPIISEEVLVVADEYKIWKNAREVSQIKVSPKQIAYLPRLGEVDIFRSLQLLPGISGISDGSSGLYIRGGTPDQNLVLLDGMTIYHVDHFFGVFSAFNSDAIKDVQVYKGGYPANFGGRLSSVVDLTGKTGDINKFKLSLGANLLNLSGVAEIPLFKKGSILISARRSFADFFESPTYNSIYSFLSGDEKTKSNPGSQRFGQTQQTVLPSFYFYDLNAKVSYNVSDDDFISLSFYNGGDYLDESEDPQDVNLFGGSQSASREVTDLTEWGNLGSSLKWSRRWSDRFYSDFTASYSNYYSDNDLIRSFNLNVENDTNSFSSNSFNSIQRNDIYDFTLRLDNEWKIFQSHSLGFGAWASSIKTNYNFLINDSLTVLDFNNNAIQASFYLQDKWSVSEDFDFTLGLREVYFDQTNSLYHEPRASFTYNFFNNFRIKGAWGHMHQFINQVTNEDVLEGNRDFWVLADEDMPPGFSDHYILGLEFETNGYLFSVEGYYKNFENLLEFTQRIQRNPRELGNDPGNYLANFFLGTGYAKGLEFLAQKKFGSFNGWLGYTLGNVENTFPGIDNGDPFPASQDRLHEVKLVGTYTVGKWAFSSAWIFATGQAYTSPESQYFITLLNGDTESYIHVSEKNSNRLPDYQRLDLSAAYRFENKSFNGEMGLSVFNVYNHKNVWYRKYDLEVYPIVISDVAMLGITPTVFIKLNF
ncbi:MAG: TonB-dependent receptor [Ignavibacteriales bacterium]|nr:TonB-dependent receptor [Ignavibacteriales bacterium]MCF8306669.1 TonB-dependent receptor [Ignavibacteriales bacterium]MCF8316231.1 TonB-dependent receptor [Ignavibacteriales bacterium]MCF8437815.1 TonB-dependent receptor [Ignavibacteriales bacterium]